MLCETPNFVLVWFASFTASLISSLSMADFSELVVVCAISSSVRSTSTRRVLTSTSSIVVPGASHTCSTGSPRNVPRLKKY